MMNGLLIKRSEHKTEDDAENHALNYFLDDERIEQMDAEATRKDFGEIRVPHYEVYYEPHRAKWIADNILVCEVA